MPNDDTQTSCRLPKELAPLRDLSRAFVAELIGLGFASLTDFRGGDASTLTQDYCRFTDRPMDPVIAACFTAISRFAETGVATPVWRVLRDEAVEERERVMAMVRAG